MLSLTGNPLFVHQWAPRHARGAAVCTSVWQIPVKWLCSGTEDTFTVTLTCFVFSTKLPVPGTLIRALSLLTHVLSSPCKASKTRCSAGCSDVQQPHPARLPTSCSSVASLALTRSTSLSTVKFICRGNHAIQEVARMQQLIATSVVAGSQRASHYHFSDDHKSQEKHRKVTKKKRKRSKSQREEWEGRELAVFC